QVTAQDAQGNTATPFTGSIGLAIVSNPGGGTLAGTTSVAAVSGVATFANVSIDKVGTGYTLAASATGPAGATSTAFNITPGAAPGRQRAAEQRARGCHDHAGRAGHRAGRAGQYRHRIYRERGRGDRDESRRRRAFRDHDRRGGKRRRHVLHAQYQPDGDGLHADRERDGPRDGRERRVQRLRWIGERARVHRRTH